LSTSTAIKTHDAAIENHERIALASSTKFTIGQHEKVLKIQEKVLKMKKEKPLANVKLRPWLRPRDLMKLS
jgi:hypothetical protein